MKTKRHHPIPARKTEAVKELSKLIKDSRTVLLASIKDIPGSQFQEIVKKLRGKAVVKVPKKNIVFRAIDSSGNDSVKKLKEQFQNSIAFLFSDMDSFDLALDLEKSKSPAKAKPGQEAPEDIEVQAGPTELVPGPAISELGALGIQIQIEKGKINIKEPKIIAKKGQKISQGAADIMAKLDIKPFSIGFSPLSAFDTKNGKLYLNIKIDSEGTLAELKSAYGRALPFAVDIGYLSDDTIKFIIGKAASHERRLVKVITGEPDEDPTAAEQTESETQETKQESSEKPKEEKKESSEGLAALFG